MNPLDRLAAGIITAVAAARPLLAKDEEPTPAEWLAVVDAFLAAANAPGPPA